MVEQGINHFFSLDFGGFLWTFFGFSQEQFNSLLAVRMHFDEFGRNAKGNLVHRIPPILSGNDFIVLARLDSSHRSTNKISSESDILLWD